MIVFRNYHNNESVVESITRISLLLEKLISKVDEYDSSVDLLIETGELESALVDTVCKEIDIVNPLIQLLRTISINAAHIFCAVVENTGIKTQYIQEIQQGISVLKSISYPKLIPWTIPEGYVYYGLYPEMYYHSASEFYKKVKPSKVVCIGLRSIGTSLSAVISARLKILGCTILSYTFRPRGHPFNRVCKFSEDIKEIFLENKNAHFLIVDEGPGLSGSTICSVSLALSELDIHNNQIHFFTSWIPDGKNFISLQAQKQWSLYDKFSTDFDTLWVNDRSLFTSARCEFIMDFSAGNWRTYKKLSLVSPLCTHPHHERRKYLVKYNNTLSLMKFSGLGKHLFPIHNISVDLADNQYSPDILKVYRGFIFYKFEDGTPINLSLLDSLFIDFAVDYIDFRAKRFKKSSVQTFELMAEMIEVNISESLGKAWLSYVNYPSQNLLNEFLSDAIAVDGKMQPYEWVQLKDSKWMKVDSSIHFQDQFFPGTQNFLWDVAGFIIEFNLSKSQEMEFVNKLWTRMRIKFPIPVLRFYKIAYLAYRIGFADISKISLVGTADSQLFSELEEHHKIQLQKVLYEKV